MQYEVILDHGESPNRCTIAPLADRRDFRIMYVRGTGYQPLGPFQSSVLLHPDGECLTTLRKATDAKDAVTSIATIDCVWKRLTPLVKRLLAPVPRLARIPSGIVTAYPRQCKHGRDPDGGLATIEAIFAAAALSGHWDSTLLSRYYFGQRFVEINADRFRELGVDASVLAAPLPPPLIPHRDARQRRINRTMPG